MTTLWTLHIVEERSSDPSRSYNWIQVIVFLVKMYFSQREKYTSQRNRNSGGSEAELHKITSDHGLIIFSLDTPIKSIRV